MNVMVVCGSPWCRLESVFTVLQAGGVELAAPAERNGINSIGSWHDRLFAGHGSHNGHEPIQPGKAWEQAAGDIFLANWGKTLWGWADPRSTWLLDFWRNFDPQVRFVLISTKPERALARAIVETVDSPLEPGQVVSGWLMASREILRFHNRNRDRSLLVDVDDAALYPQAFSTLCSDRLGVHLNGERPFPNTAQSTDSPLTALLARELLREFPEVDELWLELEACQIPCGTSTHGTQQNDGRCEGLGPHDAIGELRTLIHSAGPVLEQLRESHAALQQENTAFSGELDRLKQAAQQKERELETETTRLQESAARQLAQTEQELRSENELLLLQLHQVQEELESYYLQYQAELEKSKLADERQVQLEAMTKARDEQAQLASERQAQIQKLTQARDENAKLAAERQQQIEALGKARDEQTRLASERHAQIQKLTQARDENAKLAAERQQQIEALSKARDEQAKLASERQAQIQKLTQARDENAKLAAERQQQIEALGKARDEQTRLASERQAQIQKLTQARDENAKLAAERQQQIEALGKARDEQTKLAGERQAQIQKLTQDYEALTRSAADAAKQHEADKAQLQATTTREHEELSQENELLLLQLHQVQEELEHYFLQYQDVQSSVKEQESRWQRLLARHPDYYDWSAIEVVAKDESASGPMLRWRIKGMICGSRGVPDFELTTLVRGAYPALLFHREQEGQPGSALLRWPALAQAHEALVLQPRGEEKDQSLRWGILSGLTSTDWRLVLAACSALVDFLRAPNLAPANQSLPDAEFWLSHIAGLRQQLLQMPVAWRYDRVRLKSEQVNPDYEHLWFILDNAEFGKRRWPTFEFRLSAALVKPGAFSAHPKLEFPIAADGSKAFENWYGESHDDHGPKFELRFALDTQAMDLEAWGALSPYDQAQMTLILGGLPALLSLLENEGVVISRPWQDWQRLVAGAFATMIQNLCSKLSEEEAPPELVAPPELAAPPSVVERKRAPKARRSSRKRL